MFTELSKQLKKRKKNVVIFGYGGAGEAIFRCMYNNLPNKQFSK